MLLPSWRDSPTRAAILDFVSAVTTEGAPDFVPAAARVAVFDNDGTLWTEKPMPTQLHYLLQQWRAAAEADPALAETQPYRAAVTGDLAWLGAAVDKHYEGDDSDLRLLIAAVSRASAGASVEEYEASVAAFYRDARHLTLDSSYAHTVYQPMVELIGLLDAHDFRTYIVSGGERDFMRPMTTDYYGIPPQRVIGTGLGLEYDAEANVVRYAASLDFFNDGPQKPARIWTRIGRQLQRRYPDAALRAGEPPEPEPAGAPRRRHRPRRRAVRQGGGAGAGRGIRPRVHRRERARRLVAGVPGRRLTLMLDEDAAPLRPGLEP